MNDPTATERAKEIAYRTLEGVYDPLLACRDITSLKKSLAGVGDDIMTTFLGIASEVDDLPIGAERMHWNKEALMLKDIEASNYRERVRDMVEEALQQLLVALGEKRLTN